MALSGSVSTSSYDGRYLKLTWTATQSVANNTSTISWTLAAAGGNVNWYKTGPVTAVINGTTVYSQSSRTSMYKGTVSSGSLTIAHDSNGNKSFSISISAAIYTNAVNCTGSGSFTLNQIDRYPGKPTSVTATAGNGTYLSLGDTVTIKWSGATGTITGYQVQCRYQSSGTWSSWVSKSDSTGSSTTWTITTSSILAGDAVQFRVRAANGSLYSDWVTSNSLTMAGGVRIKVSGSWKLGTVYIKVNGAWKRATHVYAKASGAWKESI